ncbi:MAG: DSBA oxidoreductase [Gammaproteobacteria bacterium]|nr:MAG: DSBA oxidoreductase [Gammaproteobacteria bacterium]
MKIDLYFSYRSPYSYLILPRMLKLKEKYDIEINFKVVYPIAIRMPEWFEGKNFFTFFFFKMIDMRLQAKKLGIPFTSKLKPDPIRQNIMTGKISSHQPYIFDICHLGQMAQMKGVGMEFAFEVSSLIFGGVENWNTDENLSEAAKKVGLDLTQLRESVNVHEEEIIGQIKQNQVDQLNAGHHGVPLTVIGDKHFFGQDQFDKIMKTLKENGLKER